MNMDMTLIFEHMYIVLFAMLVSALVGIVLGVLAYWLPRIGTLIIGLVEVIQTIPSLALLTILMVFFGLGNKTIIIGLVLYALMPIVRNAFTGLNDVPSHIKDAAMGMGMNQLQRLVKVELPLSFPLIFSGFKIAMVNSLSIAVMGVLIGAGGLGYPIYRGIQTQSMELILSGAVPVVVMALVFDYGMSLIEKKLKGTTA